MKNKMKDILLNVITAVFALIEITLFILNVAEIKDIPMLWLYMPIAGCVIITTGIEITDAIIKKIRRRKNDKMQQTDRNI